MGSRFVVSRLSGPHDARPAWSLALFAHNEARRIRRALESIGRAAGGREVDVFVLANGCRDRTSDAVRGCADVVPNLWLVEIDLGDKANAWNVYVHDVITADRARAIDLHFFMDGDVWLEPDALVRLSEALRDVPSANAAGAMPATGRDRAAWRQRMVEFGNLSGNLYALRGAFVERLRGLPMRMPVGLFGEDRFVSWLVASQLGHADAFDERPQCVFHAGAEFSFRSLSPARPSDYRTYLRRKWRYARRSVQHEMLMPMLNARGLAALPGHVNDVYRAGTPPSRLRWQGLDTLLHLAAVLSVRAYRRRVGKA